MCDGTIDIRSEFPISFGHRNQWFRNFVLEGKEMATKEFDAHRRVKQPTKVSFQTKAGEKVRFIAEKEQKIPVHVKFKTHNR